MQGQIVKIISDLHYVKYEDKICACKCRGIFRKEHITPVVGDYVFFDLEKLIIEKILPRKNLFQRPKVSNIDQAFIVTSLKNPDFSLNLLDKFISLMEIDNVEVVICITKEDLVEEKDYYKDVLDYYEKLGYTVVSNTDIGKIKELIKGKMNVFTGQTGAGKSTLLNKLNEEWQLEVGDVSLALGRGRHTTRVVEAFSFLGGLVIDTPGFSALELSSYTKEQIRDSFREFKNYPCIYKDCFHTKEKECCVKQAVLDNNIMKSRYENYLAFIGEGEYES